MPTPFDRERILARGRPDEVSGSAAFSPSEVQGLADVTLPEDRNPFTKPPGFWERLSGVPSRLLRLPLGLIGEITQAPLARQQRAVQNFQRDLAEQTTGEEVPFSEGRRFANMISLGLIPGNPTGEINPDNLGPSESERFAGLSDLQQQISQARSSEDFAEILSNDKNFESRQPLSAAGQEFNDEQRGFLPEGSAFAERLISGDPGQQFSDPLTGDVVTPNPASNAPVESVFSNPALISSILKEFTPESVEIARRANSTIPLKRISGSLEDKLNKLKASDSTRESYLRTTKPDRERAREFRTFLGSFGQDPGKIPEDIRRVLIAAGKDPNNLNDSGIRDIALIFQFMKLLDPDSVVRESEAGLVIDSGGLPDALKSKLENLLNSDFEGELLGAENRNEIFRTITGIVSANLSGLALARKEYRALATRNGIDPDDVTLGEGLVSDVVNAFKEFEKSGKESNQIVEPNPVTASNAKELYLSSGGDASNKDEFRGFLLANGFSSKTNSDKTTE